MEHAAGFYVNVSNYQKTEELVVYGRWISSCLALHETFSWYDPLWCPGQYVEATPGNWVVDYTPVHVAAVDAQYVASMTNMWPGAPVAVATTPFVIDTSRNGQGPWKPVLPEGASGDPQDWCNPPDRGLGLLPTVDTGNDLVDAYLWIKTPGESDGQCNRWSPAGSPDPVRGIMDPPAGAWFPQQALELVHDANPPLSAK